MSRRAPRDATVAVVIVNYRTADLTAVCLKSLRGEKAIFRNLQVVLVDGGSADHSAETLARLITAPEYTNWVSFLPLELNGGFGWANNQAILNLARQSEPPEFIYLVNPDAEVTAGAVQSLLEELLVHPGCAAVGSQLLSSKKHFVPSAFRFPSPGRELVAGAHSEALGKLLRIAPTVIKTDSDVEPDWVTGASVMFRSEALRDVGLFDDGFFLYFEEVELMHRMRRRGWSIRTVPQSRVIHIEAAATGVSATSKSNMPRYWYDSRRRYFALTGEAGAVLRANIGWVAGRFVGALKGLFGRSGQPTGRLRDLLRSGILASISDTRPSFPRWGDPPGKPPAWLGSQ